MEASNRTWFTWFMFVMVRLANHGGVAGSAGRGEEGGREGRRRQKEDAIKACLEEVLEPYILYKSMHKFSKKQVDCSS